jgi:alpha-tubulin suppressor-like RCC1 family protein
MSHGFRRHDSARRRHVAAWLLLGLLALAVTPSLALPQEQGIAPRSVSITQLAAGFRHTCALLSDGTVRCWGNNDDGQLGDGTTTDRPRPAVVARLSNVTAITAGQDHTCALRANFDLLCWGRNQFGQLGDATTTSRRLPTLVSSLAGEVAQVSAGGFHTCAVPRNGSAV